MTDRERYARACHRGFQFHSDPAGEDGDPTTRQRDGGTKNERRAPWDDQ
jgi:hypothetical protein